MAGPLMLSAISLTSVFLGTVAAVFAEGMRDYRDALEITAGCLLVGGLLLLGSSLPVLI